MMIVNKTESHLEAPFWKSLEVINEVMKNLKDLLASSEPPVSQLLIAELLIADIKAGLGHIGPHGTPDRFHKRMASLWELLEKMEKVVNRKGQPVTDKLSTLSFLIREGGL